MTRQCPLFHETVLAEWRCVVIQVLFNAAYHTVFNVDNLIGLIGDSAFMRNNNDCQSFFIMSSFSIRMTSTEVLLSKAPVGSSARMI